MPTFPILLLWLKALSVVSRFADHVGHWLQRESHLIGIGYGIVPPLDEEVDPSDCVQFSSVQDGICALGKAHSPMFNLKQFQRLSD